MKAQHTPGPWSVSKLATPDYAPEFAIHAGDDDLARTMNGDSEANARLIAAAPELLELVRSAFDRFTDNDMQPPNNALRVWLNEARAAIAEAGGDK